MLDKFKKHHLGFIIGEEDIIFLEKTYKKKFIYDPIQKTRILFINYEIMNILIEFIVKEGRVKNSPKGYAHTCYSVTKMDYNNFEINIKKNNLGFPITDLEKSITKECNFVKFYYYRGLGIIELNVEF